MFKSTRMVIVAAARDAARAAWPPTARQAKVAW
jgi:hypothetical protein